MNQRQAWVQFVKQVPDLTWKERAELRFAAFGRWNEIENILDQAAAEKMLSSAPGAPTIDWLALLMELLPIILKYFFNR